MMYHRIVIFISLFIKLCFVKLRLHKHTKSKMTVLVKSEFSNAQQRV